MVCIILVILLCYLYKREVLSMAALSRNSWWFFPHFEGSCSLVHRTDGVEMFAFFLQDNNVYPYQKKGTDWMEKKQRRGRHSLKSSNFSSDCLLSVDFIKNPFHVGRDGGINSRDTFWTTSAWTIAYSTNQSVSLFLDSHQWSSGISITTVFAFLASSTNGVWNPGMTPYLLAFFHRIRGQFDHQQTVGSAFTFGIYSSKSSSHKIFLFQKLLLSRGDWQTNGLDIFWNNDGFFSKSCRLLPEYIIIFHLPLYLIDFVVLISVRSWTSSVAPSYSLYFGCLMNFCG